MLDSRVIQRSTRLQIGRCVALQQAQAAAQAFEQAGKLRRAGLVDLARQLKQHSNGFRRAEILIHRGFEAGGKRIVPVNRHGSRCDQTERGIQALERIAGIVQVRIAVVQRAAVMGADDEKAHRFGVVLFQHFADGEKVAQRLGHFLVVHPHETVVNPETGQRLAVGAFALGDFVFVVRKLQVSATAVNIKRLAQRGAAHGRAFNVPARSAFAVVVAQTSAVPLGVFGFAFLGRLPQHEVQRIVLAFEHRHALAGAQFIQRFARQLAVASKLAHGVVHVAA